MLTNSLFITGGGDLDASVACVTGVIDMFFSLLTAGSAFSTGATGFSDFFKSENGKVGFGKSSRISEKSNILSRKQA